MKARRKSAAIAALILSCPVSASAQSASVEPNAASPPATIAEFYRTRSDQPLWFGPTSGDAPQQLVRLLATAEVDGIPKSKFETGSLVLAIREATGQAAAVKRAETLFSEAYVAFANALLRDPKVGVIYVDAELKPKPAPAAALLHSAASAPSLAEFVSQLGWMNPAYARLRQALVDPATSASNRHVLAYNLERARALPAAKGRYVLVNTANQRLYMYQDGRVVDEMKVVAGRATAQTPLINAYIRFAVLNPYWYVPSDLTARLAPNVVQGGISYLKQRRYQVVSNFGDDLRIIDAATIDWRAVADGKLRVQMRQLPGPANSMGRVKFMFPNPQGVWLHDTPRRDLFSKVVRLESAGCVRLEDAWRLGSWLFARPLRPAPDATERRVDLPEPVPVYITYLTAIPDGTSIKFIDDLYKRDPPPAFVSIDD